MGLTRKEQAARSRQKLLDAACELIRKNGYDATSISDITQACDMSPGNFYNYFKSKEDLILAIEREPYESFFDELEKISDQATINQLCNYIKYYVDIAVNKFGVGYNRQWYAQHMRPREDLEKPTKLEITINECRQILTHGVQSGELAHNTPVEDLSEYIAFELHGMNICHIMSEGTFDAMAWTDKYCAYVENVMLKPYFVH